jgi:glycosyltransferase involved in cell wall biosynthesis
MSIFCSTIIPTINRSTLQRAIYSVLDQDFSSADFEVIVINDSGQLLPDEDWLHHERVKVINTNRRERSVARNTGAAVARGEYLHFLDDDDILLPGAFNEFWDLDHKTDASWLFGGWQTVNNDGVIKDEFRPELNGNIFALLVAGEGLPLQASLLKADRFFSAGGFDPTITGVEDRDLGRRMALTNSIAHVPAIVAKIRVGIVGSTTDWSRLAEDDRRGREKALLSSSAYSRLCDSANSSYWHGRVSRAYFASMVWNLKHKHILTALSRAMLGLAFAGVHSPKGEFWSGLRTKIN